MYGGYGGYPGLTVSTASSPSPSPLPPSSTLGVAASQAQSLGLNPASKFFFIRDFSNDCLVFIKTIVQIFGVFNVWYLFKILLRLFGVSKLLLLLLLL